MKKAFTLVEVLIVIAIVFLLAAMAICEHTACHPGDIYTSIIAAPVQDRLGDHIGTVHDKVVVISYDGNQIEYQDMAGQYHVTTRRTFSSLYTKTGIVCFGVPVK